MSIHLILVERWLVFSLFFDRLQHVSRVISLVRLEYSIFLIIMEESLNFLTSVQISLITRFHSIFHHGANRTCFGLKYSLWCLGNIDEAWFFANVLDILTIGGLLFGHFLIRIEGSIFWRKGLSVDHIRIIFSLPIGIIVARTNTVSRSSSCSWQRFLPFPQLSDLSGEFLELLFKLYTSLLYTVR